MRLRPIAIRWLAAALALCASTSTAGAEVPAAEADRILGELLETDRLPSISVAVSVGGEPVYARALGFADLEHSVAATAETRYSIGSVVKPLTAVAALELAERGELDLEAPVERYCPAFPARGDSLTVARLLAHTGGIRHYDYRRFEQDFLNRRRFESLDEAVEKFADDALVAEPGTEYHYSSWGYVLVGCAIEGAGERTYAEVLDTYVTRPAGMSATRLDVVADVVADRARGYSKTDDGTWANAGLFDPSDRYPAGGVLSTPTDLVRFANAVAAGKILGEAARRQMWTPASLVSGESTGHGLGWDLSEDGAEVFHGGTTVGATTFLYLRPASRIAVAIAVNLSLWDGDRLALARRLADLFAGV